jgi:ABC-type antimicrobial peptide transport system ATPase subunit
MDMGLSLGLLALAGMAMPLSGSLKIKARDFEMTYQGNAQAVEMIFKGVLPKIPGWNAK